MAICIVKRDYINWRKGNQIEAFDDRLKQLVDEGIVDVIQEERKDETPQLDPNTTYYIRNPKGKGFVRMVK